MPDKKNGGLQSPHQVPHPLTRQARATHCAPDHRRHCCCRSPSMCPLSPTMLSSGPQQTAAPFSQWPVAVRGRWSCSAGRQPPLQPPLCVGWCCQDLIQENMHMARWSVGQPKKAPMPLILRKGDGSLQQALRFLRPTADRVTMIISTAVDTTNALSLSCRGMVQKWFTPKSPRSHHVVRCQRKVRVGS